MKESINDNLINEINPSINEVENKYKKLKLKN